MLRTAEKNIMKERIMTLSRLSRPVVVLASTLAVSASGLTLPASLRRPGGSGAQERSPHQAALQPLEDADPLTPHREEPRS